MIRNLKLKINLSFGIGNLTLGRSIFSSKTRAQATTEIALFGTIMLVIFASLLRYEVIFNEKLKTQMYTFRKTLELAQRRHDGSEIKGAHLGAGDRKFAGASLNVMRNIFPPTVYVGSVQESTASDGSSTVLVENEATNFGDEKNGPEGLEDISGSYYQQGDDMVLQDKFFEPAYIEVERKVSDDLPKHEWDGIIDLLDGELKVKEYDTIAALPYHETEQYTNVTHSNYYEVAQTPGQPEYEQLAITETVTKTKFKPAAYDPDELTDELKEWDEDLIDVIGVPSGGIQDMVVTHDKEFIKHREWTTNP